MYSYHKDNRDFLIYFIFYAAFLHTYMAILPSKGKFYRIIYKADVNISFIMAKKKNQKKAEAQAKKSAVETLRFQAHWGLKQFGQPEGNRFHQLVDEELDVIVELELAQDLLAIKSLVDGVRQSLSAVPTKEQGDFAKSPTAIALGIASINEFEEISMSPTWNELLKQKLLRIYYSDEVWNKVVDWAKANGYNTSTYLGRPIVKFGKVFVIIERTRS